ncbi:sulfate permease [Scopulibacillus daqui]|uniref:Sulfate permease n=1 Tax=Scopulibacillus daqui TaxID=1469162 RepID=A0ABS2PX40_9BACL|nr:inorganic phosphate transporter [Scopulibacillus daqui]MBM7644613.1 sulfate permease [Scopulibacillus daqui]
MTWLAILVGMLFALNIGGSGAAASMGVAYGSGAVKKVYYALLLCAIGILLGATIGGGEVIKTIGSGLINEKYLSVPIVVIILVSAAVSLFIANITGIPLSTSEVTVGAVVGIGVAYQSMYLPKLIFIVTCWLIVPILAFIVTISMKKLFEIMRLTHFLEKRSLVLTVLLIVAGFFEAFSSGMNNVANSVGPLVGAGIFNVNEGKWIGGIAVGIGVLLLGRKVIETNGKKIVAFSKIEGIIISSTGASLVITASIFGIPVPMAQITTSSILGIGFSKNGFNVFQKNIVKRLLKVWVVSPLFSLILSYAFVQAFIFSNWYAFIVVVIVFAATIGGISLVKSVKWDLFQKKVGYKTK